MASDLSQALEIASRTDAGLVRPHNEDSVYADATIGAAVVADGMGGYNAGEVASGMATSLLGAELERLSAGHSESGRRSGRGIRDHEKLIRGIGRVNGVIYDTALTQPQCAGMGTTLVMALFRDDGMTVAHLGDSRLYRLRDGGLQQITHDHSLLQEQIDSGLVSPEEARLSRNKNLVTRALGVDPDVDPEIRDYDVRAGDIYLLCTDGLTDMVEDAEIAMMLSAPSASLDECAARLVAKANERGGRDNISVILVKVRRAFPATRGWWARLRAWFG
jgi:serine/threonine protein phosphatase PrpC